MLALERNSAELEGNNNAMRSLLHRVERGEITIADAEAEKCYLIAVSDRLQQERLHLVSSAQVVRLWAANPQNTNERAHQGGAEQSGRDSIGQTVQHQPIGNNRS